MMTFIYTKPVQENYVPYQSIDRKCLLPFDVKCIEQLVFSFWFIIWTLNTTIRVYYNTIEHIWSKMKFCTNDRDGIIVFSSPLWDNFLCKNTFCVDQIPMWIHQKNVEEKKIWASFWSQRYILSNTSNISN